MRTIQTLLAECVTMCGSQSALARQLGMEPTDVNVMSNGKRPISAATVGLLCDLLALEGVEAQRLAAEAVIASAKPEKQGVLRRAFFAASATGAALGAGLMTASGDCGITALRVANAVIKSTMYKSTIPQLSTR